MQARGFAVGLHSAGIYPQRLAQLLPWLDWLALDIKTDQAGYDALTGRAQRPAGASVWKWRWKPAAALECRTTWSPQRLSEARLLALAQTLAARGVRHYAVQDEAVSARPAGARRAQRGRRRRNWRLLLCQFQLPAQLSAANTNRLALCRTTALIAAWGVVRGAQRNGGHQFIVHRQHRANHQQGRGARVVLGHRRAQLVQPGADHPLARRGGGLDHRRRGVRRAAVLHQGLGNRPGLTHAIYTTTVAPGWVCAAQASSLASSRRWPVTRCSPGRGRGG